MRNSEFFTIAAFSEETDTQKFRHNDDTVTGSNETAGSIKGARTTTTSTSHPLNDNRVRFKTIKTLNAKMRVVSSPSQQGPSKLAR